MSSHSGEAYLKEERRRRGEGEEERKRGREEERKRGREGERKRGREEERKRRGREGGGDERRWEEMRRMWRNV
jgi:hypothetical protein